ncbi:hypothetical protein [Methylobacterium phyllosphaerae]|uniref:hypothetical protein n=1 Tax=Methylobacterium phyllosphaerae TaxID=418223 RepID=UPI000AF924BF|nr:hypothetical protein [Methylobacterium phyllosphaerae]
MQITQFGDRVDAEDWSNCVTPVCAKMHFPGMVTDTPEADWLALKLGTKNSAIYNADEKKDLEQA